MDIEFWVRVFILIVSLFVCIDVMVRGRQDGITNGRFFNKYFVGVRVFFSVPMIVFLSLDISQNLGESTVFFWTGLLVWIKYLVGYLIVLTALNELFESFQSRKK